MVKFECFSNEPADTQRLGEKIGESIRPGAVIALVGELGSGKTLLTRGICAGLGVPLRQVNSPTFVLVNEYHGRFSVYHMDLYRLDGTADIVDIGLLDYLVRAQGGLIIIEWAEKILPVLPAGYLKIELDVISARKRKIIFSSIKNDYDYLIGKIR